MHAKLALFLACSAAGLQTVAASADSSHSIVGEIRQNVNLVSGQFTNIVLPDLVVPEGGSATVLINYDLPIQRTFPPGRKTSSEDICQIISQVNIAGKAVWQQTISQLIGHGTLSIRETRLLPGAKPGAYKIIAQLYTECDSVSVTYTNWREGQWGGNYSYLIVKD